GFHRVQLALHDSQLATENACAYQPAKRDDCGKANYPAIASIYTLNKRLVGYCWAGFWAIYCGAILLLSFDGGRRTAFGWFNRSAASLLTAGLRVALGIGPVLIAAAFVSQGIAVIEGGLRREGHPAICPNRLPR